jgi:integration host factor subunit beta
MNSAMTRSELAAQLALTVPDVPVPQVEEAVKVLTRVLAGSLASGERIEIRGFGGFSLRTHPPRLGRNPKTGEQVEIRQKRVPHFKPGKAMRERVDQPRENGRGLRSIPEDGVSGDDI